MNFIEIPPGRISSDLTVHNNPSHSLFHTFGRSKIFKISSSLEVPILCLLWYCVSIATSTSSKAILNGYPKPLTLTLFQFSFIGIWCIALDKLSCNISKLKYRMSFFRNGIVPPSREILRAAIPLALFQIVGHALTLDATSRLPVSLVHTIKGLSPFLTVTAYRVFLGVRYSLKTYLSLFPITLGVFLACSTSIKTTVSTIGILTAFFSTISFVAQNIYSKNIFETIAKNDNLPYRKLRGLDKLNLICYTSLISFLLLLPVSVWFEFFATYQVESEKLKLSTVNSRLELMGKYSFNGTVHFFQTLIAFTLLSKVSPVTYSIASLVKRAFIIIFTIIWFRNNFSRPQTFGICLTLLGLYIYDHVSHDEEEKRKRRSQSIYLPQTELFDEVSVERQRDRLEGK